jgi:hypothetical protein
MLQCLAPYIGIKRQSLRQTKRDKAQNKTHTEDYLIRKKKEDWTEKTENNRSAQIRNHYLTRSTNREITPTRMLSDPGAKPGVRKLGVRSDR